MSQLQLTTEMLNTAKDTKALFEIVPLKNNFVENYRKTTGKENGDIVFERERVLFLQKIRENPGLEKCTNISKYMALIQLAASGLTMGDDQCYMIPKAGSVTFQVGWKGRLAQISSLKDVIYIQQPQVVYEGDDFEFSLGDDPKIIKHVPCKPSKREKEDGRSLINYVYVVIATKNGKLLYIMDREEVLNIRDRRSDSYKYWKKNGGKESMWTTDEPQAFRKTVVKRAYQQIAKIISIPQTMKDLDSQIDKNPDPEDGNGMDYGLSGETPETLDVDHEEIDEKPF